MTPINPPDAVGPRNGDLPAFVRNGCIGLRVREVPIFSGMAIVNGVAGQHHNRLVEAAAPCPYPLAADLAIDGVKITDQPWAVSSVSQRYDFSAAELHSRFDFRVKQKMISVDVVTFASRSAPSVILQRLRVRTTAAMRLTLQARVETPGVRGRMSARFCAVPGTNDPVCDGSMLWHSHGDLSSCGIAFVTALAGGENASRSVEDWDNSGPLVTSYEVDVAAGNEVELTQMASLVASLSHSRPSEEAVRRIARARLTGFEELRRRNRLSWQEIWKGRPVIHGARREHQELVDAGFFYLNSSVHGSSLAATSIFGLATWNDYHYYYGHVMWDIDMFCLPVLSAVQPEAARAILDFRSRGMRSARLNAQLSARDGLQFPWEAAPLSGDESAPGAGESAAHEDHGNLHVSRAFAVHANLSGDANFLRDHAWPVLAGVADWIVSRAQRTERGYEILKANGPAETLIPPNNDAFTNVAAKIALENAMRAARRLGREENRRWRDVSDRL